MVELNSLANRRPDLIELLFDQRDAVLTCGSGKKVIWRCDSGYDHTFDMRIADRVSGKKCPYCSGRRILPGFNDLATARPDIAQYFNVEETRRKAEEYLVKRWALSPEEVTVGSGLFAIWDCENGERHWFEMKVIDRLRGRGCAVCAGRQVFPGFNDLDSLRPDVAALWEYQGNAEKNKENTRHPKTPKEATVFSNRICSWLCIACDGVFERKIQGMTMDGVSQCCPSCTESQGEKELAEFIANLLPGDMKTLRNDRAVLLPDHRTVFKPRELDVYIPELSLAFEFNGDYWHSDDVIREKKGTSAEEWHRWKLTECDLQGIDLFFVWESDWNDSRKRVIIEKCIEEIVSLRTLNELLTKSYSLLTILSKG